MATGTTSGYLAPGSARYRGFSSYLRSFMELYTDGNVAQVNPSTIGGAWAWVYVAGDVEVARGSGFVTPEMFEQDTISNNLTELLAAIRGLEAMADGWAGILLTDSNVTRGRILKPEPTRLHYNLKCRLESVKRRLGSFEVVLLSGHPTKAQLASGVGKGGRPVSKWNVLCDQLCTQMTTLNS